MTPDAVALAAIVILIFPMGYFFLAAPAFLLVKLDIPPVTQLLRGMFNAHFLMTSIAAVIGVLAFAAAGRLVFVIGIGLIAAFAVWDAAGFCGSGMPSSAPGMPATPLQCAGCGGCIGAACCATRSCFSLSSPAFLTSAPERPDQVLLLELKQTLQLPRPVSACDLERT